MICYYRLNKLIKLINTMRTIYSCIKTKIVAVGAIIFFSANTSIAFAHNTTQTLSTTTQGLDTTPYIGSQQVGPYMMDSWSGYGTTGIGLVEMLVWIAFWILVITLIVMVARKMLADSKNDVNALQKNNSALEILRKRYAQGEIDTVEYKEREKALVGK